MSALEDRIARAFGSGTTSIDVARLIGEAEAASIAAAEAAQRARDRSLDPTLPAVDMEAARRESEDARFNADRMRAAVAKLGERKTALEAEEEQQRRRATYEAAKVERDQLAKELKEFYPEVAARLADLARRITTNNDAVAAANNTLPSGFARLGCAEMVARDINCRVEFEAAAHITSRLRLPAFHHRQTRRYEWPPHG
jgi:chromosome segregation ATPase